MNFRRLPFQSDMGSYLCWLLIFSLLIDFLDHFCTDAENPNLERKCGFRLQFTCVI